MMLYGFNKQEKLGYQAQQIKQKTNKPLDAVFVCLSKNSYERGLQILFIVIFV